MFFFNISQFRSTFFAVIGNEMLMSVSFQSLVKMGIPSATIASPSGN